MNILSKMNIEAHQNRPLTPENKKLTFWRPSKEFLHCCIESCGCHFSYDKGACIMCDYGIGRNLTPIELQKALAEELQPCMNSVSTLLFGAYGSVLDTQEVSEECFDVLMNFLVKQKIRTVIFETHCCTINEGNLKKIREKLRATNINAIIEMGFESCDSYILENYLNKVLNLKQLCNAIALVHQYGMEVSLNVFLGTPFLCEKEQLDSAVESVKWAFEKGADSVVVFPCNIKPFTLLHQLYTKGIYKPISQWMLVELLSRIQQEKLDRVTLSWYGDRGNFYENGEFPLIPPSDCENCHDKIFNFYHTFMKETSSIKRKQLVDKFIQEERDCHCQKKFRDSMKVSRKRPNAEELKVLLETIKMEKSIGYEREKRK